MTMYFLTGIIFFGIGFIFKDKIKEIFSKIYTRAMLVKGYWIFSIFFVISTLLTYWLIVRYSNKLNINRNISILNHMSALLFAIFVGYYAFLQVMEGKLDKYKEIAYAHLKEREYNKARQYYEKAYAVDPKDESVIVNLTELYLILNDFKKFDLKIKLIKSNGFLESSDEIIYSYLKAAKYLLKQELGEAKKVIKDMVTKTKGESWSKIWNFHDIKDSETFKRLDGESKTIFSELIEYIQDATGVEKRKAFEEKFGEKLKTTKP